MKRLLEDFKIEAAEHYRIILNGLLELEKSPGHEKENEIVEAVFREVHSLKGAARAVSLSQVERLCSHVEDVFSRLKKNELTLDPPLFDALHASVDILDTLLAKAAGGEGADLKEISGVINMLEKMPKDETPCVPKAAHRLPEASASSETVRISSAKLGGLLLQAEELITAKLAGREHAAELRRVRSQLSGLAKNFESAMAPSQNEFFKSVEYNLKSINANIDQDNRTLGRNVDILVNEIKKTLMFPFSSCLEFMPKLVRDLSRDSGKEVNLTVTGSEIEMDRRILEEIKDPLIHLIRNCIDYGIEKPEARKAKNKPAEGAIMVSVSLKTNRQAEITVSDDGAGVDIPKVIAAAVKSGIVTAESAGKMTEAEVLNLIFHTGLSTSPIITDISGRGLGLAIVLEKAEKLGGSVSVESAADAGTTFRIVLPLMLASFRGVAVEIRGRTFLIPLKNLVRVMRVKQEDIKTVENRDTVKMNGQVLGLFDLGASLGLSGLSHAWQDGEFLPVLVVSYARKNMAFLVDNIIGEEEGLIKNLGSQLKHVRNIAGATLAGSGRVMPIIDIADLIESAPAGGAEVGLLPQEGEQVQKKHEILVAEDSITARNLLKNILESAGYTVGTAVDGMDAFTSLRGREYDLLVSDVDMPRMNGFDLTSRIRGDAKLAKLPVVLVTALESREDRERGIDSGADAYIVKSGFDQASLLDTIRRLIV
ncbi:MAG: response regulator [Spirochaetota bacterium]